MMAGSTMVARPATRTTGRSERGCDGCGAPYGCRATPGGQASLRRAGHATAGAQVASGVGCGGRENVLGLACACTYMETG